MRTEEHVAEGVRNLYSFFFPGYGDYFGDEDPTSAKARYRERTESAWKLVRLLAAEKRSKKNPAGMKAERLFEDLGTPDAAIVSEKKGFIHVTYRYGDVEFFMIDGGTTICEARTNAPTVEWSGVRVGDPTGEKLDKLFWKLGVPLRIVDEADTQPRLFSWQDRVLHKNIFGPSPRVDHYKDLGKDMRIFILENRVSAVYVILDEW